MSEHKTEHKKGNGHKDHKEAEAAPAEPVAAAAPMAAPVETTPDPAEAAKHAAPVQLNDPDEWVFEGYFSGQETVEGYVAVEGESGILDGVHGAVGYKKGDLIVKDGEPITDTKQFYYVIPAEAAENWEKGTPPPPEKTAEATPPAETAAAPATETA